MTDANSRWSGHAMFKSSLTQPSGLWPSRLVKASSGSSTLGDMSPRLKEASVVSRLLRGSLNVHQIGTYSVATDPNWAKRVWLPFNTRRRR